MSDNLESPEQRAKRKWSNHDLAKRVLEERRAAATQPIKIEPEIGDVIENEGRRDGSVVRAQTKFLKDLREMLNGHTKRNLLLYKLSLKAKKHKLLSELYKRQLAQQAALEQEEVAKANKPVEQGAPLKGRDLFS